MSTISGTRSCRSRGLEAPSLPGLVCSRSSSQINAWSRTSLACAASILGRRNHWPRLRRRPHPPLASNLSLAAFISRKRRGSSSSTDHSRVCCACTCSRAPEARWKMWRSSSEPNCRSARRLACGSSPRSVTTASRSMPRQPRLSTGCRVLPFQPSLPCGTDNPTQNTRFSTFPRRRIFPRIAQSQQGSTCSSRHTSLSSCQDPTASTPSLDSRSSLRFAQKTHCTTSWHGSGTEWERRSAATDRHC
mmetsp:Transcript_21197/g.61889  ORF Transcript_21197/g.61889 Transcript_21197/m.61889 type:complete len:247 (+) Transcript_21197:1872-2612(+)